MTGGLLRLWIKISNGEYDIVHLLILRNYMVLFLPLLFLRTKIIVSIHDTLSLRNLIPKNINHFLRIIFIKYAKVVFVFNQSDKELLSHHRKNKKETFILKHGFDKTIDSSNKVKDFRTITILFSGGLGKLHKGLNILLQALKHLRVDYKLLICGTNYSGENHKNYIGALDEKEYLEILSQSKIVVVPSKYESFSLVALEAFASGIPVILTKSTGISDYLVDGKGCFIVEYGDVKDLAKKIELLLTDGPMWMRMSNEALTVAQEFDWKNIIDKYIHIYNTV